MSAAEVCKPRGLAGLEPVTETTLVPYLKYQEMAIDAYAEVRQLLASHFTQDGLLDPAWSESLSPEINRSRVSQLIAGDAAKGQENRAEMRELTAIKADAIAKMFLADLGIDIPKEGNLGLCINSVQRSGSNEPPNIWVAVYPQRSQFRAPKDYLAILSIGKGSLRIKSSEYVKLSKDMVINTMEHLVHNIDSLQPQVRE